MSTLLRSTRLLLQPLSRADEEGYCALHTDPVVMAWIAPVLDRSTAQRSFRAALSFNADTEFRRRFWFARTLEGVGVGLLSLDGRAAPGAAELGAIIATSAQRRGHASEAILRLAGHAFETLGLQRLYTRHRPGHGAAVALMRRLGFTPLEIDAANRDPASQRWQLLRTTWREATGSTFTQ